MTSSTDIKSCVNRQAGLFNQITWANCCQRVLEIFFFFFGAHKLEHEVAETAALYDRPDKVMTCSETLFLWDFLLWLLIGQPVCPASVLPRGLETFASEQWLLRPVQQWSRWWWIYVSFGLVSANARFRVCNIQNLNQGRGKGYHWQVWVYFREKTHLLYLANYTWSAYCHSLECCSP